MGTNAGVLIAFFFGAGGCDWDWDGAGGFEGWVPAGVFDLCPFFFGSAPAPVFAFLGTGPCWGSGAGADRFLSDDGPGTSSSSDVTVSSSLWASHLILHLQQFRHEWPVPVRSQHLISLSSHDLHRGSRGIPLLSGSSLLPFVCDAAGGFSTGFFACFGLRIWAGPFSNSLPFPLSTRGGGESSSLLSLSSSSS